MHCSDNDRPKDKRGNFLRIGEGNQEPANRCSRGRGNHKAYKTPSRNEAGVITKKRRSRGR